MVDGASLISPTNLSAQVEYKGMIDQEKEQTNDNYS